MPHAVTAAIWQRWPPRGAPSKCSTQSPGTFLLLFRSLLLFLSFFFLSFLCSAGGTAGELRL